VALSPTRFRQAAEARRKGTASYKAAAKQYAKFQTFHLARGTWSQPPTYEAVGDYLASFVQRQKDGSTRSLTKVLSQLRTQHRARQAPFLSVDAEQEVKELIGSMKLADSTVAKQMEALRFKLLASATAQWDLSQVAQLQEAVNLTLPQNMLLRTAETTGNVRASDCIWDASGRSACICLRDTTKTSADGTPTWIQVHESSHPLSGLKLLKRLWKVRQLDARPAEFLFCSTRGGSLLQPERRVTPAAMRRSIKRTVASIGLDPSRYSGHSLRAGGATDMFARGLPYYVIKRMGRWRSDAALCYFRCERTVAKVAASAFSTR
jgi:hypothetical protein